MQKQPCVYILASRPNGTLYIGVTSDIRKRIWEHKNNVADGFTRAHNVHRLAWYEPHETMESAIAREKILKKWERAWKIRLIDQRNRLWDDLYEELG